MKTLISTLAILVLAATMLYAGQGSGYSSVVTRQWVADAIDVAVAASISDLTALSNNLTTAYVAADIVATNAADATAIAYANNATNTLALTQVLGNGNNADGQSITNLALLEAIGNLTLRTPAGSRVIMDGIGLNGYTLDMSLNGIGQANLVPTVTYTNAVIATETEILVVSNALTAAYVAADIVATNGAIIVSTNLSQIGYAAADIVATNAADATAQAFTIAATNAHDAVTIAYANGVTNALTQGATFFGDIDFTGDAYITFNGTNDNAWFLSTINGTNSIAFTTNGVTFHLRTE